LFYLVSLFISRTDSFFLRTIDTQFF